MGNDDFGQLDEDGTPVAPSGTPMPPNQLESEPQWQQSRYEPAGESTTEPPLFDTFGNYSAPWTEPASVPAPPPGRQQKTWAVLRHVLALGVVVLAMLSVYRLIYTYDVENSGALFLGLPVLIALMLIYAPRGSGATSTTTVFRSIVLVVAVGAVALPEGVICWILILPLLLLVGAVAVAIVNLSNRKNPKQFMAVLWLPLLVLSGEGLVVGDLVSPNGRATATQSYSMSAAEVEAALSKSPEFGSPDGVLGLGFPEPIDSTGEGLSIGHERIIRFTGEADAPPAILHLVVSERSDGRVVFANAGDTTHLAKWLTLTEAEVLWTPTPDGGTEVSWTLRWHRELHPGLYFGPVQQLGMTQAAGYLLDTVVG